MIIRIWAKKIPIFDVLTFFLDGHTENGWFDPFLHRNANGNMSHLKEQKKCYRIRIVSEDRGGGAYRATIHPRLSVLWVQGYATLSQKINCHWPPSLLIPSAIISSWMATAPAENMDLPCKHHIMCKLWNISRIGTAPIFSNLCHMSCS